MFRSTREAGHDEATTVKMLIEIIGWTGAGMVVLAYALLTMRRLAASALSYQWLNLLGSAGLIVNGAWNGAFPSVFLNAIWLAVTGYAIVRARPAD